MTHQTSFYTDQQAAQQRHAPTLTPPPPDPIVQRVVQQISKNWVPETPSHDRKTIHLFGGWQGSGKTTLIRKLTKDSPLTVISTDRIRSVLIKQNGFAPNLLNSYVQKIEEQLLLKACRFNHDVAVDANAHEKRLRRIHSLFREHELYCTHSLTSILLRADNQTLQSRIKSRQNNPFHYTGTLNELRGSQELNRINEVDYDCVIDTSQKTPDIVHELVRDFLRQKRINYAVAHFSSKWNKMPEAQKQQPFLFVYNETDHPQALFLNVMKRHIKGVLVDGEEIQNFSSSHTEDIPFILSSLLHRAKEYNQAVVLHLTPKVDRKMMCLAEAKKANPHASCILLEGGEVKELNTLDFDLHLPLAWNECNHIIVSAVLSKTLPYNATVQTPIQLITLQEARTRLKIPQRVVTCHRIPEGMEQFLLEITRNAESLMLKYLPIAHAEFLQRFPVESQRVNFLIMCTLDAILLDPSRLSLRHPETKEEISTAYERLNRERQLSQHTFKTLSQEASKSEQIYLDQTWWPFDDGNRVCIKGEPDLMYATCVRTENLQLIASSAPVDEKDLSYFWRLLWQSNVHTVISLARPDEFAPLACRDPRIHLQVDATTSEMIAESMLLNNFAISNQEELRCISQLSHTNWPDHGIIPVSELHELVQIAAKLQAKSGNIVVHCRAGLGRTGTFCAACELYAQFLEHEQKRLPKNTFRPDVFSLVLAMNLQRHNMVQTEEQFSLLYEYVNFLKT